MRYLVIFEKGSDGTWGAYVPDLPGCTAVGTTKTEAKALIGESIRLWIETAQERGWEVPAPSSSSLKLAV
jgi:predicted RNase H-like HicB family nuclease